MGPFNVTNVTFFETQDVDFEKYRIQITKLAKPVQNQGACLSWTDNEIKRKQTSVHSTVGRALERTAAANFILRTRIFFIRHVVT